MILEPKNLRRFVTLAMSDLAYTDRPKKQFHKLGKTVAKAVAESLGLPEGSFDIRSNMAGIGVSGEITLHGERIYLQFEQFHGGGFMYRTCNGRKDYTGGPNQWMKYQQLLEWDKAMQTIKRVLK